MLGRGRVGDLARGRVTVTQGQGWGYDWCRGEVSSSYICIYCRMEECIQKERRGRGLVEIYSGVRCGVA